MAKAKSTRKKSAKRKPGRPRTKTPAVLDEKRVGDLALLGLSNRRIAERLGASADTLKREFASLLDKKRAERAELVAATQLAILNGGAGPQGRTTMAIWLGKNELAQTDKASVEHKGSLDLVVHLKGPSSTEAA